MENEKKVQWKWIGGSNSSMHKEGTFSPGMTRQEVEKQVIGSWGGRFEYFDEKTCKFKYVAYTD